MTVNWTYTGATSPQVMDDYNNVVFVGDSNGDIHYLVDGAQSEVKPDPSGTGNAPIDITVFGDDISHENFTVLYDNGDVYRYENPFEFQGYTNVSGDVRAAQPVSGSGAEVVVAVDNRVERWDVSTDTLLNTFEKTGEQMVSLTSYRLISDIYVGTDNGKLYRLYEPNLSEVSVRQPYPSDITVTELDTDFAGDIVMSGNNTVSKYYDDNEEWIRWEYDSWWGLSATDINHTADGRTIVSAGKWATLVDGTAGGGSNPVGKYEAPATVTDVDSDSYNASSLIAHEGGEVLSITESEFDPMPERATPVNASASTTETSVSMYLSASQTDLTVVMNDATDVVEKFASTPVSASASMNFIEGVGGIIRANPVEVTGSMLDGEVTSLTLGAEQVSSSALGNTALINASYFTAQQVSVPVTMNETPLGRDVSGLGGVYWKITQEDFEELVIDGVSVEGGWPDFVVGESTDVEIVLERRGHSSDYERLREYGEFLSDSSHSVGRDYQQRPYYSERLHPASTFDSTLWKLEPGPGIRDAKGWWVVIQDVEDNVQYGGIGGTMTLLVFVVAPVEEAPRNVIRQRYEV